MESGKTGRKQRTEDLKMGRIGERPYWVLYLSIGIRALHQVGAAVFLCAYLPGLDLTLQPFWLALAGISGGALLFTEWLRHRQIVRELSGLATLVKLILLGAAVHGLLPVVPTVLAAFLLASLCAHAPKTFRHRLLY